MIWKIVMWYLIIGCMIEFVIMLMANLRISEKWNAFNDEKWKKIEDMSMNISWLTISDSLFDIITWAPQLLGGIIQSIVIIHKLNNQ